METEMILTKCFENIYPEDQVDEENNPFENTVTTRQSHFINYYSIINGNFYFQSQTRRKETSVQASAIHFLYQALLSEHRYALKP